jgi:HD-like signal output (HDOD) protein/CRP-like cAMP-binding protein
MRVLDVSSASTNGSKTTRLGDLLVAGGFITDQQLQEALNYQRINGGRLGVCLIKLGYLGKDILHTVLTRQFILVAAYNAAPVRHLKKGEPVFAEAEQTDSFFVLLDGFIQIVVKWDVHAGRPGIFRRGDCVAPLPKSPGLTYCSEAIEPCTVIEITPAVLNQLSDKTQVSIYKVAIDSTSKINAYIRAVNGEVSSKNALLADYIVRCDAERSTSTESEFVQKFMRNIPQMPAYATDLAVKLLDDKLSVQQVVEGIKRDPSIVASVLRTVNSAQYSFQKKIENFYHACMILGFNNIYNLIVREAVKSAMPLTPDTKRIHTHACLLSVLCYEVAAAGKEAPSQTATTIGLLHDIGKGVQVLMKVAQPTKEDYIDKLPAAKLGAQLLALWGLPDRICKIVEFQRYPEFMAPDSIAPEYRRETATLHIAHILEALLTDQPVDPSSMIYTRDYMGILGLSYATTADLLKQRIIPTLTQNRQRIPKEIRALSPRLYGQ